MRRPSVFARYRGDAELKMTPMIDVVFLLLVFFVWTASFQAVEYLLPTSVSAEVGSDDTQSEEPPPDFDFENVVVRILWDGANPSWSVNDQNTPSLAAVRQRLQVIADIKADVPVILHPDDGVPIGNVIDVYDLSLISGFDTVQFAISDLVEK